MGELTIYDPALPVEFREALERAADYARHSRAKATLLAYANDFRQWSAWCDARKLPPMAPTPASLCAFLSDEAERGRRPSTISRRLAAIKFALESAGLIGENERCVTTDKRVSSVLAGIRRQLGAAPRQKKAMTADLVLAAVASAKCETLRQKRDKAIVLLGFGGAFRRSELVALEVADLEFSDDGLRVRIKSSKTDQAGVGETIAVAAGRTACPARAVREWLDAAGISSGPVFVRIRGNQLTTDRLAGRVIATITKTYARRIGLDEREIGAHSLRAGWITSAAARGASVFKMKEVSRHKSLEVLSSYVRDANLFRDHAGAGLL